MSGHLFTLQLCWTWVESFFGVLEVNVQKQKCCQGKYTFRLNTQNWPSQTSLSHKKYWSTFWKVLHQNHITTKAISTTLVLIKTVLKASEVDVKLVVKTNHWKIVCLMWSAKHNCLLAFFRSLSDVVSTRKCAFHPGQPNVNENFTEHLKSTKHCH